MICWFAGRAQIKEKMWTEYPQLAVVTTGGEFLCSPPVSVCRELLVLWEGILIDGYNRFNIAQKHNLPYNTISMGFGSRDELMIWIIRNQIARRNLTPFGVKNYFWALERRR